MSFSDLDPWDYLWNRFKNPNLTLVPTWGKYSGPGWIAGQVWNVKVPPPELVASVPPDDWTDSVARKHDVRFILCGDIEDSIRRKEATKEADRIFVDELKQGISEFKITPFTKEFAYASAAIVTFEAKILAGMSNVPYSPLSKLYRLKYRYVLSELERNPFSIIFLPPDEMFDPSQETVDEVVPQPKPKPKPKPTPKPSQPEEQEEAQEAEPSKPVEQVIQGMTKAELREFLLTLNGRLRQQGSEKLRRDMDLLAEAYQIPPVPNRFRW